MLGALIAAALATSDAELPCGGVGQPVCGASGPIQTYNSLRALGEAGLRAQLKDPDSAQIAWPFGFVDGTWKPAFGKTQVGRWTCGTINAKNSFGGYVGPVAFVVLVRSDNTVFVDSDSVRMPIVGKQCARAQKQGLFAAAPPVIPANTPMFGVGYTAVPEGASVSALADGFPAALAGLKQGMVVEKVNGISLRGFTQESLNSIMTSPYSRAQCERPAPARH